MTTNYGGLVFEKFQIAGDSVMLEKVGAGDLKKAGDIFIPTKIKAENSKIGTGKVIAASETAKNDYHVDVGDYVLYDYYSAHGDYPDKVIVNAPNLLLKMTKEEMEKFIGTEIDEGFLSKTNE